jgi:HlyD family secretion protein
VVLLVLNVWTIRRAGPAVAVTTTTVQSGGLKETVVAPATLEADQQHTLRAPAASKAVTLLVQEGDAVTAGQVLAQLDVTDLSGLLAQNEQQLAQSKAALVELERRATTAPEQAVLRVEAARRTLALAELNLEKAVQDQTAMESGARDRLLKAQADLLSARQRLGQSTVSTAQLEEAQERLKEAEQAYQQAPHIEASRQVFEAARATYADLLNRRRIEGMEALHQLEQAKSTVDLALEDLERTSPEAATSLRNAREQVESARVAQAQAEVEAATMGVLPEQLEAARVAVRASEQQVNTIRSQVQASEIRSPVDGVILALPVKNGDPVAAQAPVALVGRLDQLRARVRVDEADILKVRVGQPVKVTSAVWEDMVYDGTVRTVTPQGEVGQQGSTTLFQVEVVVGNPDGRILPGMNVDAEIVTEQRSEAVSVPNEAVLSADDGPFVFVLHNGRAEPRHVTVGIRTETRTEIVNGLQEGDQVITGPFATVRTLKPGALVTRTGEEAQGS